MQIYDLNTKFSKRSLSVVCGDWHLIKSKLIKKSIQRLNDKPNKRGPNVLSALYLQDSVARIKGFSKAHTLHPGIIGLDSCRLLYNTFKDFDFT